MGIDAGWHDACIYDLEHTNKTYAELSFKYGRSKDTIMKLKKRRNVTRPNTLKRGNSSIEFQTPIDTAHRNIGIHLSILKGTTGTVEMAEHLGVSTYVLRKMELGLHPITLQQLMRLARAADKSIPELMSSYMAGDNPDGH